jgi:hypothetical protein
MAKTTDIGLSGSLGNLIFYKNRGKQCSRTRPAHVKLSKESRKSAGQFGIASAMSATIRRELVALLPKEKDLTIMYRLNAVLLEWLRTGLPEGDSLVTRMPFIGLYPIINNNPAWGKMRVPPVIQWEQPGVVTLALPSFIPNRQISAPRNTESVRLEIMALCCKAGNPCTASSKYATFTDIPYTAAEQEARNFALPLTLQPGEIALIILGLKYAVETEGTRTVVANKEWQPIDIIGAAYLPK